MRSILGATLFLLFTAGAAWTAPAGTVVGISGACFVESATTRSALQLGAAVHIGDTVDVAAHAKLKLRMADGSILSVASGTRMAVTAYTVTPSGQRQDVQLSLPQGLLHAVVAPTQTPARFEVDTAVGVAAVRSTDWLIEATANDQQVSVLSGSVVVTSAATRHSVVVSAYQTSRVERGRDPLAPRPLSRAGFARILGRTEMRHPAHAERPQRAERPTARHPARPAAKTPRARRPVSPPKMAVHRRAPARRRAEPHPDSDKTR